MFTYGLYIEAYYRGATSLPWAPTIKRGSVFLYGGYIGCVGKLVTPGDCKSSVVMALLVQVQPHPPFCFYSQASIRYRVWTHTLFGSQRPAIDPNITASAFALLAEDA